MIETCESADNHSHFGKSRRGPKISKELPCLDKSCIVDGFCGSFLGKSNIFEVFEISRSQCLPVSKRQPHTGASIVITADHQDA